MHLGKRAGEGAGEGAGVLHRESCTGSAVLRIDLGVSGEDSHGILISFQGVFFHGCGLY